MVKIGLHGDLAEIECPDELDVQTPMEAIQFMISVVPGFKEKYFAGQYTVERDEGSLVTEAGLHVSGCRQLDFYPLPCGAGAEMVYVAIAVASSVLALALAPKISAYEDREDEDSRNSFIFSGAKNTVEQGVARPVLYGKMEVGGHIISAGLTTEQL